MNPVFNYSDISLNNFSVVRIMELYLLNKIDIDKTVVHETPFDAVTIFQLMTGEFHRGIYFCERYIKKVVDGNIAFKQDIYDFSDESFQFTLKQICKWAEMTSGDDPEMTIESFFKRYTPELQWSFADVNYYQEYMDGTPSDKSNFAKNFYQNSYFIFEVIDIEDD